MNDHTDPTAPPEPDSGESKPRNRLRTGPIVWGALFLAFCAWVTQRTFFPDAVTPELWLTGVAIGLGALLLIVGIAVGLRDRRN